MNTLIIPCAGRSSRFPGMKPKYLLTHPDGKLMIEKSFQHINHDIFDRIIITIVEPHNERYEAGVIIRQVFQDNPKVELCVLDDFTSSASETVYKTIAAMNVQGGVVLKDSDNAVGIALPQDIRNMIIGYDIGIHRDVSDIPGKSFLIINEQGIVQNIIEKQIVSNVICVGVYCFQDVSIFNNAYEKLYRHADNGEMYISHVISHILSHNGQVFEAAYASYYEDWGSLKEWKCVQEKSKTYFVDFDGVLIKNSGKYGRTNWSNNRELLEENITTIKKLQDEGAQIVITTSRTEEYREAIEMLLASVGIKPYAVLVGMNHAARVVINDFASTNPYPSGIGISIPRNAPLKEYLPWLI